MDLRPSDDLGAQRGVRTTKRRGRMTPARHEALEVLGPHWDLAPRLPLDRAQLEAAFGRPGPFVVDVGVGNGAATVALADERPECNVVAVELHRPGVAQLLGALDQRATDGGPSNVRIVVGDATALLASCEPGTFDEVRILFPDPWPKRRHVDRRLVDAGLVATLADLLPTGGRLHVATDHPDYADQVRKVLADEPRFEPKIDPDGPSTGGAWRSLRPPRPVTAYERRGIEAGRPPIDLVAVRR